MRIGLAIATSILILKTSALFKPLLNYRAPIKKVELRSRPNPFVNDELLSFIRTRDFWRKIARKANDPLAWAAYRNFKREVKRDLRLAEREQVENRIRNNPNKENDTIMCSQKICEQKVF